MPIDYKRYPPNWKKEIVPSVLARANNCCEVCGVPNKSMQWRGRKIVEITALSGRKRKGFQTFHYYTREEAIDSGCESFQVYQTKIVLTVAHLDHDETNWNVQLDRLKAMCQLCHLKYDSHEKFMRTAMGAKHRLTNPQI